MLRPTSLAPLLAVVALLHAPCPDLRGQRPGASATPVAAAPEDHPLLPDTILAPPGGPRIVVLGTPGSGVAALRLHVPLREGPAEAGVGLLLRELVEARMESLARPVGARVSATRTPWGLAYAVEGSVADFEYLAYLLREAVARPDVADVGFTHAGQRLAEEVARSAETPEGRLAAELRAAVSPGTPPPGGTPATLGRLTPGAVLEAWSRSHRAPEMTLVVSAGVIPEVVLAATRGMGASGAAPLPPRYAPMRPGSDRTGTQTLRRWHGRAWTGGDPVSPLGPVTALLLSAMLEERDGDYETTLQLRELPDRWAILVMGAAYRRSERAMRAAVDGALDDLEAGLDPAEVARAAARVRRDILFRARTPLGLTEVVGRGLEAGGDPGAAARHLAALDDVGVAEVRAFLAELRAGPGARAEVGP